MFHTDPLKEPKTEKKKKKLSDPQKWIILAELFYRLKNEAEGDSGRPGFALLPAHHINVKRGWLPTSVDYDER